MTANAGVFQTMSASLCQLFKNITGLDIPPLHSKIKKLFCFCKQWKRRQSSSLLTRGLFEWNFARKAELHLLAVFFVGLEKHLLCNMSLIFSGNFLITSFSRDTPCQKIQIMQGYSSYQQDKWNYPLLLCSVEQQF